MTKCSDAPLMLSVSGVRGIVGKSMTPEVAGTFAAAFASVIEKVGKTDVPVLVVGRDGRESGKRLSEEVIGSLKSTGFDVIDLGVAATPTVSVMVRHQRAAGGMVITASHNPAEWNGLKCLTADGAAPSATLANKIIQRFQGSKASRHQGIEASSNCETKDNAIHVHIERVLEQIDTNAIQQSKFKIVLDSVNGAGGPVGSALLEALGCDVVHVNNEPNGNFAHAPEPLEENLTDLARSTECEKAACGFAQDPDADRLAIVDETGRYIGEEYTLVLSAKYALETFAAGTIVTNLSTSRMIDDLAARYPGTQVIRTPVGEANVVETMMREKALIGGEGNGGVIYPDVCWTRDSISAMAFTLSLLAKSGGALSEIVNDLPRYVMMKKKFDLTKLGGRDALQPAFDRLQKEFSKERITSGDGIRIDFAEGWIHLRPSNTEPIARLIAEGSNRDSVNQLIDAVTESAALT